MTPPLRFRPELLLGHAAALRSLARSLVSDPHAAEDAVQETWCRAIENPPARQDKLGGWLATVLANVVRSRQRSEDRRARREREAARSEAPAGAGDPEVLREVVDAVLALREPYRGAVMMRYFEGLTPKQIASRLEVPLATVNSRLQRALVQLRERLEARQQPDRAHWTQALTALTGLGREPAAGVLTPALGWLAPPGVVLVSMKVKVLAGALLAALIGWGAWTADPLGLDGPAPVEVGLGGAAPQEPLQAEPTAAEPGAPRADATEDREALAAEDVTPTEEAEASEPYAYELEVEVLSRLDLPVTNADVLLGLEDHPLNTAGKTGEAGKLRVTFFGRAPTLPVLVAVRSNGNLTAMRRIELTAGSAHKVTLGVEDLAQQAWYRLERSDQGSSRGLIYSLHVPSLSLPSMVPGPNESKGFTDPLRDESYSSSQVSLGGTFELSYGAFSGATTQTFLTARIVDGYRLEASTEPELPALVEGTVLDAQGEPAVDTVVWVSDGNSRNCRTTTDAEGRYRLEGLLPGPMRLRAGGGDHGRAWTNMDLAPGAEARWEAFLERGVELEGRLASTAGTPLAGWWVEVVSDDPEAPYYDIAETDEVGAFAVPNLPSGALTVLAYAPDNRHRFPSLVRHGIYAGGGPRDLEVDADQLDFGTARVTLVDAGGEPDARARARLHHRASGRLFDLTRGDDGALSLDKLPPGRYDLYTGRKGFGLTRQAPFDVLPGEKVDLGVIPRQPVGFIEFEGVDPVLKRDVGLYRRGHETESWLGQWTHTLGDPIELLPGSYTLTMKSADQEASRSYDVEIEPGGTVTIVPDARITKSPAAPAETQDR